MARLDGGRCAKVVTCAPQELRARILSERERIAVRHDGARIAAVDRQRFSSHDESRIFPVSGYTLGYVRDLSHGNGLDIGLGTQFTINDRPDSLDRYYGDALGYAFQFFLRIRPSLHSHAMHQHGEHVAGMEK